MWTFLTNHTHVLFALSKDPDARVRDLAVEVGITERATQRILNELREQGVVERERRGRRNHYVINRDVHLRHPLEEHCCVGELLDTLGVHNFGLSSDAGDTSDHSGDT